MELREYQEAAVKTRQPAPDGQEAVMALLGMVGEAGAVATAYKKQLRDGPSDVGFKARMREELGDVLWYLSVMATQFGLDLNDIAASNLVKISDRWRPTPAVDIPFDSDMPDQEQLPRSALFEFDLSDGPVGRPTSKLMHNGEMIGDPITDASHVEDGYCFHDVFHLAYAAVLGWSPVIRAIMKRKRKSDTELDLAEDGGRAIAIEEGIAALVFSYASEHEYLEGKSHIDNHVLEIIKGMVAHLEVSAHKPADWEKAILVGFATWRELRRRGGGTVKLDMPTQSLDIVE